MKSPRLQEAQLGRDRLKCNLIPDNIQGLPFRFTPAPFSHVQANTRMPTVGVGGSATPFLLNVEIYRYNPDFCWAFRGWKNQDMHTSPRKKAPNRPESPLGCPAPTQPGCCLGFWGGGRLSRLALPAPHQGNPSLPSSGGPCLSAGWVAFQQGSSAGREGRRTWVASRGLHAHVPEQRLQRFYPAQHAVEDAG